MDKNQLHVLELQSSFSTEVTAFQSKVWNTLKTLDREIRDRLEVVEKRLDSVAIQTRIQSLLEELNK
jgi:vacuolar-type H+-ATPase subunit D/Vma8